MKKKSDKQKQLEGTVRKDRQKTMMTGSSKIPHCPYELTADGQKVYDAICDMMITAGVLHDSDAILVGDYVKLQEFKQALYLEMNYAENIVQTYANNSSNVAGHLTALSHCMKQQRDIGSKLGLSPKDRQTIQGYFVSGETKSDRLQKFLAVV